MSDFFQNGEITTLHRLGPLNLDKIEAELCTFEQENPIALVLPCLYSELEGEALPRIVEIVKEIPYLTQIVVSLGNAAKADFDRARDFFSVLPQETRIIWNDGPMMSELFKLLEDNDVGAGESGKGRAVWIAFGYVLAARRSRVISLHDCDILSYDRALLARLCYPVANLNLGYEFCKGYYSRVTDRLHGRVTRLFVTPLVRALKQLTGLDPFLEYLDSFRYPLAGECSLVTDLARINRIPGDWGLEVGTLAEVYRNCTSKRICQVDISENYEHKHQVLSPDDPGKGLLKMSIDIAKSIFRTLASEGVTLAEAQFRTLAVSYLRRAQDTIKRYEDDARINGLYFDRHEEGVAVETFSSGIRIAGAEFLSDPFGSALIPNWSRVTSAIPNFLHMLKAAVDSEAA